MSACTLPSKLDSSDSAYMSAVAKPAVVETTNPKMTRPVTRVPSARQQQRPNRQRHRQAVQDDRYRQQAAAVIVAG